MKFAALKQCAAVYRRHITESAGVLEDLYSVEYHCIVDENNIVWESYKSQHEIAFNVVHSLFKLHYGCRCSVER